MVATHADRQLAAILAADVEGYSRLVERDEEGTVARLKAHRKELIEPLIAEHHGRIAKLMGDGALCEFASVVDAVRCAVAVHHGIAAREGYLPETEQIRFRIGINLGDIIHEDGGDILGDAVNVAARLEQLSEPGGLVISGTAYDHLQGKIDFPLEFMGEQRVKNIERPIRVYKVRLDGKPVRRLIFGRQTRRLASVAAMALLILICAGGIWHFWSAGPPPALATSVAVLPFANMSGDPNLDYFSDGLTEDLTTQLARHPELEVVARNSAFVYKGKDVDVKVLGRELGARFVLEGSARISGRTVRVTAQLIDATTGLHVWADRFDEEGTDIFGLQDRVTQKVIGAVVGERGQIRAVGHREAFEKPTADLAEYDYFLRIHALIYRFTREDMLEALRVAREGLGRFPDSGLLRIKLGWVHLQLVRREWSANRELDLSEAYRLAEEGLARRALPAIGQLHGHWLMANALVWYKRDYERALAERETALASAGNDPEVFTELCDVLTFAGRADEVIRSLPKVLAANPVFDAMDWPHWTLAYAYFTNRQYEDAIAEAHRSAEADRVIESASLAALGRSEEAQAVAQQLLEEDPSLSIVRVRLRSPFKNDADLYHLLDSLRNAGLPEGVQAKAN